jgi:hypothetical protein
MLLTDSHIRLWFYLFRGRTHPCGAAWSELFALLFEFHELGLGSSLCGRIHFNVVVIALASDKAVVIMIIPKATSSIKLPGRSVYRSLKKREARSRSELVVFIFTVLLSLMR